MSCSKDGPNELALPGAGARSGAGRGAQADRACADLSGEEALRLRILQAAHGKSLEPNAGAPRWWEWISAWIPVAVPMGVTACLAATLRLQGTGEAAGAAVDSAETAADSAMVLATFSDAGFGSQVTAQLIAPEGDEWLLSEAFVR